MRDTIEIGSSPANEICAQLGSEDYILQARRECKAYINQLYRFLESKGFKKEELPSDFSLVIKSNSHDFGSYLEIVCKFESDNQVSRDLAYMLENSGPTFWDEEAKRELNLKEED